MPVTIKDSDRGYKRTLAALGPLGGLSLGVQGKEAATPHGPDQGVTIGEIAAIHELGLGTVERSWLRAWVDENQAMIVADCRDAMKQVILGRLTKPQALDVLGLKWVGSIQQRIADGGVTPELAESTIKRKGSAIPLIDEGIFRAAITHVARAGLAAVGKK